MQRYVAIAVFFCIFVAAWPIVSERIHLPVNDHMCVVTILRDYSLMGTIDCFIDDSLGTSGIFGDVNLKSDIRQALLTGYDWSQNRLFNYINVLYTHAHTYRTQERPNTCMQNACNIRLPSASMQPTYKRQFIFNGHSLVSKLKVAPVVYMVCVLFVHPIFVPIFKPLNDKK